MAFTIDHSQAKEIETIKPGEYEVVVINYELKQTSTGKNMVVVDYEIRSDVEQPCKGKKLLYDNFVVSETTMWRFHSASKAAGFPNGKQFNSFKDWADFFLHKNLRVVVALGNPRYNGQQYPEVKGFKESQAPASEPFVIKDEDIPF